MGGLSWGDDRFWESGQGRGIQRGSRARVFSLRERNLLRGGRRLWGWVGSRLGKSSGMSLE